MRIFKHISVQISALNAFLNDCKKCADAPPRPAPQSACTHLPPPSLLRHWASVLYLCYFIYVYLKKQNNNNNKTKAIIFDALLSYANFCKYGTPPSIRKNVSHID